MSCQYSIGYPWLWSTWVKAPILKNSRLVIASACLPYVNRKLFEDIARDSTVLFACPEREHSALYGKIASIIRSSRPSEIHIVTIDGSPHCFNLHASANEAEYILGEKINKKHFVVLDGEKLIEIDPNSIRVARYLHLVDILYKMNRELIDRELMKHSLEYRKYSENKSISSEQSS
ncbi:putative 4Fe-4S ferredoxin protein [Ignisphaera aggregans DSM 17230]|uniref:Putative 4Fe-4S ferredoxin protein n=1 Tax=Ignisphaera aggregans (strain DSM 17230 / JCM 13409 / AQ1.S1) TaxID=583356 RepID=E0SPP7_IGNAA|nr:putative 4Fe-4S ferredoxin protein [Ignisphaera aggregans DSM 17230]